MENFKLILENNSINYRLNGISACNFLKNYKILDHVFEFKSNPTLEFTNDEVRNSKFLSKLFTNKNKEYLFPRNGAYNSLLNIRESYYKKEVQIYGNAKGIFYEETNKIIDNLICQCKNGITNDEAGVKFKLHDYDACFLKLNSLLISDWYNATKFKKHMGINAFLHKPMCIYSNEKFSENYIKEEIGKLIICLEELKF